MSGGRREQKRLARQKNNDSAKQLNAAAPNSGKVLPIASEPQSTDDEKFQWSGTNVDHDYIGEWSWHLSPKEIQELLSTLTELARLTWREVRTQTYNGKQGARRVLHKGQSTESLCPEARSRLEALCISTENVFRLRRGTDLRIWGYLQGPILHLIWYDRDHKVCPVDND